MVDRDQMDIILEMVGRVGQLLTDMDVASGVATCPVVHPNGEVVDMPIDGELSIRLEDILSLYDECEKLSGQYVEFELEA